MVYYIIPTTNIGIISEIKEFGINVYVAPHPANRKKNGRVPKEYMSCFVKI
jgi:hypothetical protein